METKFMHGKPEAQIAISESLIRGLLNRQQPDLAELPLVYVGSGWDNEIFRLGERFAVRMPRRDQGAASVLNEQAWLPTLAERLPVAVPTPIRNGVADDTYPWSWSVVPWFDGMEADLAPPASETVPLFADLLKCLHVVAPKTAPHNAFRGAGLADRTGMVMERMQRVAEQTDLISPQVRQLWNNAVAVGPHHEKVWLHGDLHAQNVLTEHGTIQAIIDWGDLTSGDPAVDLISVWSLYPHSIDRERLLSIYAPDAELLARAKGWVVLIAMILIDAGLVNNPRHVKQGRALLSRLLADS